VKTPTGVPSCRNCCGAKNDAIGPSRQIMHCSDTSGIGTEADIARKS
jgi:hypothetical protein